MVNRRDIGVRLVVEGIGTFTRDMGRYNDAISKAESATVRFGERVGRAGRAIAALGAPIAGFAFVAVRAATDFDTALVGVAKTTNATTEELAFLEAGFRDLALEIPQSAAGLANIGEIAGRLGVPANEILNFTEVVAALGVATNLTNEEAAEFVARIQTITGLPADEIGNFSSALVELGNNLATSEAEIAAFALRMAGAGNVAGLTQAEILAIAGSFSELGVQAQRGGTAVQRVLFAMVDASANGGAQLESFAAVAGVTTDEFVRLFREDASEAFVRFVEGLGRSGDQAFAVLEQLGLSDQRLAQAFITAAQAGDSMRANIDLATNAFIENNALTEEAERRYASFDSQLQLFRNVLTELAITVGDILLPPLIEITQALTPIIRRIADFAKEHPTLTKVVVAASIALVGIGVTLAAIGFIVPGIVAGFGLLTTAVGFLSGAFAFLTVAMGPITLIVLGIAAAIAAGILIWKNWDKIIQGIRDTINTIIDVVNKLIDAFFRLNPLLAPITAAAGAFGLDIVPEIPQFAHGGQMLRGGRALVGERGPEVVTLPAGAQVTPISRINEINVQAQYTNPQEPNSIRNDMEFILMSLQA